MLCLFKKKKIIRKDFTAIRYVYHNLKVEVFRMILKGLLIAKKSIKYQSENRGYVVDCVQVFLQIFDHVDHLDALEICV